MDYCLRPSALARAYQWVFFCLLVGEAEPTNVIGGGLA